MLNGASSSGKSSIAAELQQAMDDEYLHLALDRFRLMRPKRDLSEAAFAVAFQQTILGFHRAVAGMAAAGCNVIVDSLFGEQWRLNDFVDVTAGLDVVFVKVWCDLDELNRRERERGDRKPGIAAAQYATVHALVTHDIEVDRARPALAPARRRSRPLLTLVSEDRLDVDQGRLRE